MKLFIVITLLFVCALASCTKSNDFSSNNNLPQNKDQYKPILQITSNFDGLWWMNGEVLDFRLFENGIVEYDEYPLQSKNGTLKAEEVKVLYRTQINEAEVKEILDLLNSKEFLAVEFNKIVQDKGCWDAFINSNINFKQNDKSKNVILESYCANLSDTKSTSFYFKDFPKVLTQLFQKIKNIKSRESAGKFYL